MTHTDQISKLLEIKLIQAISSERILGPNQLDTTRGLASVIWGTDRIESGRNFENNTMADGGTTTEIQTIYAITPTYSRLEQKADLIRLSQTLMHVEHFHWVVVEDSNFKTALVTNLLSESGLNFTHLNNITPIEFQKGALAGKSSRGVQQRNAGLDWLRQTLHHGENKGVVYFMDDDNTYDIRIFQEMRYTKRVSVWPVGLVGGAIYESPIVKNGKVTGWFTGWGPHREFAIDMAGFAVNLDLVHSHPNARFSYSTKPGNLEGAILKAMGADISHLEPKANNCTQVLVWHTKTSKTELTTDKKLDNLEV
ncbi:hypothetical protein ScPMuIL_000924 [Solemya velum]